MAHKRGLQDWLPARMDAACEDPDSACEDPDCAGGAAPVHLSQSALSRLIDRLEKNGLVERCLCGEDRRGIYVVLIPAGLRRHAEAAPVHREVLARTLSPELVQCGCTDTVPA